MGERDWNNRESRDWNSKPSGPGWDKPADEKVIGTIDHYELLRELGTGGFGSVYLARDTVSRTFVAVKGLPQQVNDSAGELERIRANYALVSKLKHPNVAAVLALHRVGAVACGDSEVLRKLNVKSGDTLLVMDYAPGVTLDAWCRQFPDRKVPVDQAIEVTRQIAAALDVAHKMKIVHRDIKPQNVMVETLSDGTFTVRVLDFGLAAEVRSSMRRASKVDAKEKGDSPGTIQYMAPEQLEGHQPSAAMDQYALTALFYELVTGDVPFSSVFECGDKMVIINVVTTKSPEIPRELPRPVRMALARALAKRPEKRFASCGDFVAALQGAVRVRRGLVAGILAAVAVAGAGAWWLGQRPGPGGAGSASSGSLPITPSAPAAPTAEQIRAQELAAETAVFALSVEMENASQRIAGESEDVRAFFASEIHAFENVRKTGNDAKANKSYVTATNFFVQAKAQADALKRLVTARASCLKAKEGAEAAKRSADAVNAKAALAMRYEEADKALGEVTALAEKRDFRAGSERAESARSQFAALRTDVVKVALGEASGHKAAERWQECLAIAEKVLGWEPQNAAADALKQEAERHLIPTLRFVAKIGDREIPATATFGGKSYTSPWRWERNVQTGLRIPSADVAVEYTEGGKRYEGTIKPVTVDWKGPKTVVVSLTEYKGPVGVQLWENGPYWAECNVGATKPEDAGYYFWWGDTTGYRRNANGNGWVSVADSMSFEFDNCPTDSKSNSQLRSDGYIDATGNLAAAHDAATAHLGEPWRMPTDAELSAMVGNCTTAWTTCNGVEGRLVTGKGAYSSKSIFLPAAGCGYGSILYCPGVDGDYWSSTPSSGSYGAWRLSFSAYNFDAFYFKRCNGFLVRPVRGFAK